MFDPIVEAVDLNKSFDANHVLRGVSFTLVKRARRWSSWVAAAAARRSYFAW